MLDPRIVCLLETTIDTSCKLAVALKFIDHRGLCATPAEMAARVCRDIWSVEAALEELAADGVLVRSEPRFVLNPAPDVSTQLDLLKTTYAEPLQRDELHELLRDLETYAPYRREARKQRRRSFAA